MKNISAIFTYLAKVECSCCGDDHYIEVKMPKKKCLDDNYCIDFYFQDSSMKFSSRVRRVLSLLKHKKMYFENKITFNDVLLEYDQIAELYSTLKLEYEQNDILHENDINTLPQIEAKRLSSEEENGFPEHELFNSDGGLILSAILDEIEGEIYISNMSLGYGLSPDFNIKRFDLIKRGLKYIFKPDNDRMFSFYECSLSKNKFIEFMNILNWIVTECEEEAKSSFSAIKVKNASSIIRSKCESKT